MSDEISSSTVVSISEHRILKDIAEQTGLTKDNSNIVQALQDAKERADAYEQLDLQKARKLAEAGLEPCPCFNIVCKHYHQDSIETNRMNWCDREIACHSCLFQMLEEPPNSLNYDEPMPSHKAALTKLEELGQLKGQFLEHQTENSRYERVTRTERNEHMISGITMDCLSIVIETAIQDLIDNPYVPDEEKIGLDQNKQVIARNATVEVEKAMGIFPNLRRVKL
jgi:hypothetical protein